MKDTYKIKVSSEALVITLNALAQNCKVSDILVTNGENITDNLIVRYNYDPEASITVYGDNQKFDWY